MRRTFCCNLTPEDRATQAKWVRIVVAFYGCAALLLLLLAITLADPSPVQPPGSALLADPSPPC
jgi:hypothetical protein